MIDEPSQASQMPGPEREAKVSRRGFAKYITAGGIAAAIGGIWALRRHFHSLPEGARLIAQADAIPVDGSIIFQYPTPEKPCILIRTGETSFVAYSRICTHNGCPVSYNPDNRDIECPCHGGVYSIADGSVLAGPPPKPLPRIRIELRGNDVLAMGIVQS